jgi:hypothetical protein
MSDKISLFITDFIINGAGFSFLINWKTGIHFVIGFRKL